MTAVPATLQQALQQASARLEVAQVCFGHGTHNAFDEAAWLVLWRLGLPLDALDQNAERVLTNRPKYPWAAHGIKKRGEKGGGFFKN